MPLCQCRQQLTAAISSLQSHSQPGWGDAGSRPHSLGGALEAALHLAVGLDQAVRTPGSTPQKEQPQQRGAATQQPEQQQMRPGREGGGGGWASNSSGVISSTRLHILLISSGPAAGYASGVDAGPSAAAGRSRGRTAGVREDGPVAAAAAYFEQVAQVAAEQSVTVDVVVAAEEGGVLTPLAQATGGILALHAPPPGEGTWWDGSSSRPFAASISAACQRPAGLGCQLEVHTSSGLAVEEAYGAGAGAGPGCLCSV